MKDNATKHADKPLVFDLLCPYLIITPGSNLPQAMSYWRADSIQLLTLMIYRICCLRLWTDFVTTQPYKNLTN